MHNRKKVTWQAVRDLDLYEKIPIEKACQLVPKRISVLDFLKDDNISHNEKLTVVLNRGFMLKEEVQLFLFSCINTALRYIDANDLDSVKAVKCFNLYLEKHYTKKDMQIIYDVLYDAEFCSFKIGGMLDDMCHYAYYAIYYTMRQFDTTNIINVFDVAYPVSDYVSIAAESAGDSHEDEYKRQCDFIIEILSKEK